MWGVWLLHWPGGSGLYALFAVWLCRSSCQTMLSISLFLNWGLDSSLALINRTWQSDNMVVPEPRPFVQRWYESLA